MTIATVKNEPAKKRGRPPKPESERVREGKNLNVWINEAIYNRFEETRSKAKRSKTAHLEYILERVFNMKEFAD